MSAATASPDKSPEKAVEQAEQTPSPQDEAPQGRIEEGENTPRNKPGVGDDIERASSELKIQLPGENVDLPIKVIALVTLFGGSSVLGATFVDLFNAEGIPFGLAIIRVIAGFLLLLTSYGLVKRRRWSLWLYALIVIGGAFINAAVAILLFIVVAYLIWRHNYFTPSALDKTLSENWGSIKRTG